MSIRDELYSASFSLREEPRSLPATLRTQWRVPLVPFLVAACRSQKAKREQLIVLNWVARSPATAAAIGEVLDGTRRTEDAPVRYEPALVRAVNIARALDLVGGDGETLTVTEQGHHLRDIVIEAGLYERERTWLASLSRGLPHRTAVEILRGQSA